jgi:hypothetical protein
MSNPFKVGDICYCVISGNKRGTAQVPVGTRGEVFTLADDDYVVVNWELPGCRFVQPVVALSHTPPEEKK